VAIPKRRARRSRLLYALLVAVSWVVRRLPIAVGRAFGAFLGHIAFHVARRDRRVAMENLAIAFPGWSVRQRRATVRRMCHHLGKSMMEIAWMPRLDKDTLRRTTEIHGVEHIDAALAAGRGVLIFTGHCGNWEWLAATVALLGYRLTVLQRERDEPHLNRFITRLRARFGIVSIDRGSMSGAREMFRTLRQGGMLAFLIDQNIRAESVNVPFFGKPALTPIGPARLAVRAQAPVMICFIERQHGKQIVRFQPPMFITRESDPVEITARLTAAIEEQIRRVPEQWVWFHRRWRERSASQGRAALDPSGGTGSWR